MKLASVKTWMVKLTDNHGSFEAVDKLSDAQGLWFPCPKCYAANHGMRGTHYVLCWFVGVSQDIAPKPGRWIATGTDLTDISFVGPNAASVLLTSGCKWHGYIRNGETVDA